MPLVSQQLVPVNGIFTPSVTGTGTRNGTTEWGVGLSGLIQQSGVSKTQLEGFGNIFSRVTKSWMQPQAAAIPASPNFLIPMQVKTNDYMLVQVTTVVGTTITTPSGWTLVRSDSATGSTGPVTQSLYSRFAAGTAGQFSTDCGTLVSFNLSNTATAAAASLLVYANVSLSSPINVQGVASATANGTTATSGALTTTAPNTFVLQLVGTDTATINATNYTGPASYITRANNIWAGLGIVQSSAYDIFQAAAGTTGTTTTTWTNTGSWIVHTLALTPATTGANVFTPVLTPAITGGTLAAGTYAYRVSAWNQIGTILLGAIGGETLPCPEVTASVASGTSGSVALSWTAVPNALGYKVYGRTTGAEQLIATITGGSTTTFTDTGAVTPSGALNPADTTSDTGQIVFGAIASSIPTNNVAGYEIFQFTDATQATLPVFLKVEYAQNSYTGLLNPQVWITVGSATTGTGTITNMASIPNSVSSRTSIFNTVNAQWGSSTGSALMYADSDGGSSLMFGGWVNPTGTPNALSSGGTFIAERTREWDGTFNTDAIFIGWMTANLAATFLTLLYGTATQFTGSASALAFTPVGTSQTPNYVATIGNTVYLFPMIPNTTPRMVAPSKHLIMCWIGDVPAGVTVTTTLYGSSRGFLRTNSIAATNLSILMRTV